MHPYYRDTYRMAPGDVPTAASLYPEIITLPLYPDMNEDNVRQVCDAIKTIVQLNLRTSV
jgi:dTDP-4-amino-4,6-dideoxygalactose transaminase